MRCAVDNCEEASRLRLGLCDKHYMRQRRNGHTAKVRRKRGQSTNHPHSPGYIVKAVPSGSRRRGRLPRHAKMAEMQIGEAYVIPRGDDTVAFWGDVKSARSYAGLLKRKHPEFNYTSELKDEGFFIYRIAVKERQ